MTGDRYTLHHGNNLHILPTIPDNTVDAIVTDPPYELGFMGKQWDASGIAYNVELWAECLRVLKPGGHLLAFGGTRTYHRMTVAIEDAGFDIRDSIHWIYGSGFPKSLDVSKAIDKVNGEPDRLHKFTAWMRTTALTARQLDELTDSNMGGHYLTAASQPAIPTATMWQMIRPHCGEVPAWVDELVARIEAERQVIGKRDVPIGHSFAGPTYGGDSSNKAVNVTTPATDVAKQWDGWGTALKPAHEPIVLARKPLTGTVAANVIKWGTGALNIDGTRIGGEGGRWPANVMFDTDAADELGPEARYFYVAKTSRAERNAGGNEPNRHPTVKPITLMRYLIRLVTPPDGTVLDPFAGSGTTLAAAILEGHHPIGIELTDDYHPIIHARCQHAITQHDTTPPTLFDS